jgi:hypothetical protein
LAGEKDRKVRKNEKRRSKQTDGLKERIDTSVNDSHRRLCNIVLVTVKILMAAGGITTPIIWVTPIIMKNQIWSKPSL